MILTQSEKQSLENSARNGGTKIDYLAYNPGTVSGNPEGDAVASGLIQYKKTTSATLNEVIYTSAAITNYGPGNEFVLDDFFGLSQPLNGHSAQSAQSWGPTFRSGANINTAIVIDGNGQITFAGLDAVGLPNMSWPSYYTMTTNFNLLSFTAGQQVDIYLNETALNTYVNVGFIPLANSVQVYGGVTKAGVQISNTASAIVSSVTYPYAMQLKAKVNSTSLVVSVGATTLFTHTFASGSILTSAASLELKSGSSASVIKMDNITIY